MKRSTLEIQLDVLRLVGEGVRKPTRIMYACNLSWLPLSRVLSFLLDQGAVMVKRIGLRDEYYITEKGRSIMEYYEKSRLLLMEKTEFATT